MPMNVCWRRYGDARVGKIGRGTVAWSVFGSTTRSWRWRALPDESMVDSFHYQRRGEAESSCSYLITDNCLQRRNLG